MPLYPVTLTISRNLRQAVTPMRSAEVYVFRAGTSEPLVVYPDWTGGAELIQPILTDINGKVSFYVTPGRVRVDARLDLATTESIELVVPNEDENLLPIIGEQLGTGDGVSTTFQLAYAPFGDKIAIYIDGRRCTQIPLTSTPIGPFQYNLNTTFVITGEPVSSGLLILADYIPRKTAL
jgi:hypothetical protein